MSYDSDDSSELAKISTKKLAILFGLAFFGALVLIQMIQGFPIADLLFRERVTEEVQVKIKTDSLCIVEPSDSRPREIHDCPYNLGDTLTVTYTKDALAIESHRLK